MAIKQIEGFSVGETDFINEHTRHLLSTIWAPNQISTGRIWADEGMPFVNKCEVYLEHARRRGWISSKEDKVLGQGFKAAAAFLRR
jgi:hypothetical protein